MSKLSKSYSELSLISRRALLLAAAPAALLLPSALSLTSASIGAQDTETVKEKEKAKEKEEIPIPEPEDVRLKTKDGVHLVATFYGSNKGKEAVPIVMLPMWKRNRNDFSGLALNLQKQGYAVLTVDLRGHGESTETEGAAISATKLSSVQFKNMVMMDMDAVKRFLWEKNNEQVLNLNKLVLLGGEMGASVAINFAIVDWAIADYGPLQLGRFTKALILLSPEWSFKGLDLRALPVNPAVREKLAILMLVGKENNKAVSEANRIYEVFKKYHEEPTGADRLARKTLFLGKMPTSLQGSRMLEVQDLNLAATISTFLKLRMIESTVAKDLPWKELKLPHE